MLELSHRLIVGNKEPKKPKKPAPNPRHCRHLAHLRAGGPVTTGTLLRYTKRATTTATTLLPPQDRTARSNGAPARTDGPNDAPAPLTTTKPKPIQQHCPTYKRACPTAAPRPSPRPHQILQPTVWSCWTPRNRSQKAVLPILLNMGTPRQPPIIKDGRHRSRSPPPALVKASPPPPVVRVSPSHHPGHPLVPPPNTT